ANAEADGQDGVMRRPWSHLSFEGKNYAYLGLQSGLQALAGPGGKVETLLHRDRVEIIVRDPGGSDRRINLPLDGEGRLLVNWAGNARRKRGADATYFASLPFIQLLEFYTTRYVDLDGIVRRTIQQFSDEERTMVKAEEYLRLSDRLGEILQGKVDV